MTADAPAMRSGYSGRPNLHAVRRGQVRAWVWQAVPLASCTMPQNRHPHECQLLAPLAALCKLNADHSPGLHFNTAAVSAHPAQPPPVLATRPMRSCEPAPSATTEE